MWLSKSLYEQHVKFPTRPPWTGGLSFVIGQLSVTVTLCFRLFQGPTKFCVLSWVSISHFFFLLPVVWKEGRLVQPPQARPVGTYFRQCFFKIFVSAMSLKLFLCPVPFCLSIRCPFDTCVIISSTTATSIAAHLASPESFEHSFKTLVLLCSFTTFRCSTVWFLSSALRSLRRQLPYLFVIILGLAEPPLQSLSELVGSKSSVSQQLFLTIPTGCSSVRLQGYTTSKGLGCEIWNSFFLRVNFCSATLKIVAPQFL